MLDKLRNHKVVIENDVTGKTSLPLQAAIFIDLVTLVNAGTVLMWVLAFLLWGFESMQKHVEMPAFVPRRDAIHSMLWVLIVLGLLGSVIQSYDSSHRM